MPETRVWEDARRGRGGRWTLLAALVVVVVAARLLALPGGEEPEAAPEPPSAVDEDPAAPDPPPPSPTATPTAPHPVVEGDGAVFSDSTGTVLLFDDGGETGVAIRLDSGARRRVPLVGPRPGDQPFHLWPLGREVVVGAGEIYAVMPADGSSRHLGSVTIFLPAAEPSLLWLIDYSGGAVGSGPATWTLIDASGEQLHRVEMPLSGLEPVRGLPGGLAVRTRGGGLTRYDIETQQLTSIDGSEAAWVGDVTTELFAWCADDPCASLSISDAAGEPPAGLGGADEEFFSHAVWLSPDGAHLAAWVRVRVGDAVDLRLRVYDVASGQVRADTQTRLGNVHGQWSEDGEQFIFGVHASGSGAPSLLGRWAGGERVEQVDVSELDLDGSYGFVALPETVVPGLFDVVEPD